jgi:hypothetical protein
MRSRGKRQPVVALVAVVDAEIEEQGTFALAFQGQPGVWPKLLAHQLLDSQQEGAVGQGFDAITGFCRVDVDAFAIGQLTQQFAP